MSATVSISRSLDVRVLKLTRKTSLAEGAAFLQHALSDWVWDGHGRFPADLSNKSCGY
jgi:hypothetical protein